MSMRQIGRRKLPAWSLLALVPSLGACDLNELLEVEAPTQILASTLDDPAKAPDQINSMVGTFHCALGAYIINTGELSDVLSYTGTNTVRSQVDARNLASGIGHDGPWGNAGCSAGGTGSILGVYTPVQESRWYADDLLASLEGWTDAEVPGNRAELIGTAALHAGYGYVLVGEAFCSAALDEGPEITPAEVFNLGLAKFSQAIASGNTATVNAAYVGRARLKLNLDDLAGAASDAAMVPAGFAMSTTHSTADLYRYNRVSDQTWRLQEASINAWYQGLDWQGVPDPRVAVQNVTQPRDTWAPLKYQNLTDPIRFASWEEAQLIMAEAQGGQAAIDILDQLHMNANLPPTGLSATDAAGITNHVTQERARELFLEGQRLYDMIRLGLPFLPPAGDPYPGSGGGVYGTTSCMPLPPSEYQNNDNVADR